MLTSRVFVAVVIGASLAAMVWLLQALHAAQQLRADAESQMSGETIAAVAVRSAVDPGSVRAGRLPDAEIVHLQSGVGELRRQGKLIGLELWRLDGTSLFSDSGASTRLTLSSADLQRVRSDQAWMVPGIAVGGRHQLAVFVPLPLGAATSPAVVAEVIVPRDVAPVAAPHQLVRQEFSVVVMFLLLIGGVVWLRRRLRRSELQARTDELTGLLNRRALHEDFRRMQGMVTPSRPVALLLMDLSEFKSVNDTLGHSAGDLLLQQVASALSGLVRAGDSVFRLGGDEFAVLLTALPDADAARDRAERLLADLRVQTFAVQGIDLTVDASIGVALAPTDGTQVDELVQHADVAMYQAKRTDRGVVIYDAATDRNSVDELAMVAELRQALDNKEFVLHYQPKIKLPDRRVVGVEALVRWQHPTRGLLPPGAFLPVLESTGLMAPLTRWVLREAVHQAASWRRAGMHLPVAVNISPRNLLDYDLPARVLATLRAAELPASFLELEITENAIMINPERAAHILTQLRARGVGISIDDFGAGYTSLAFLRILPVTALKVDQGLVTRMLECPEDEAVTQAVIELAHRLGFQVVAEGVETEPLLERLSVLGCDQAQGYLMSRPLAPAALEGWLTAWQADHGSVVHGVPR